MRIAVADNPDGRILPDARIKILRHFKTQVSDEYPVERLMKIYCPVMAVCVYDKPEVKEVTVWW